ncbi:unnamed protein product [Closterium sp. Naga37s-1]|nr:unnamed protein product [Closterium sp. Naga37s-1]
MTSIVSLPMRRFLRSSPLDQLAPRSYRNSSSPSSMATPDRVSLSSGSSLIGQPLGIVDSPSGSPRRSFSAERPPVASRHGHASPARARAVQQSQSDSEGGANGNGTGVPLRVAYQGVPGAYSEMAAMRVYPGCSPVPCDQFDDAFNAVEQWLVGRAVLPIENSLGGSIHRNYDLLLRHRLHIVGEVHLPVHHCLLALPGSTPGQLTRVLSHPQALAQCEATLTRLGVVQEAVYDTAGAAQMVANQKMEGVGAVASTRAAEIYGLEILAEGIQDEADNFTRFLALARDPVLPSTDRPFKTSIVFTLEKGAGVLFKALSVFALRDINLTKIESRPHRDKPLYVDWLDRSSLAAPAMPLTDIPAAASQDSAMAYQSFDYLFYIDFQASLAEPRVQNAMRHLQEMAPFLRVLGSYPMDVGPMCDVCTPPSAPPAPSLHHCTHTPPAPIRVPPTPSGDGAVSASAGQLPHGRHPHGDPLLRALRALTTLQPLSNPCCPHASPGCRALMEGGRQASPWRPCGGADKQQMVWREWGTCAGRSEATAALAAAGGGEAAAVGLASLVPAARPGAALAAHLAATARVVVVVLMVAPRGGEGKREGEREGERGEEGVFMRMLVYEVVGAWTAG